MLKVDPGEIRFEDVQPGILYVMTFSVRNLSTVAQRIRIQAPKSSFFALNYIPSGPIAPGLDLRAEIECQIPAELKDNVFNDRIYATMGNEKLEIPLAAVRPLPIIQFERTVNFGNILMNQTITKDIEITNNGAVPTIVQLSIPRESSIVLSSNKIELKAAATGQNKQVVRLQYVAKETGPIREIIKLKIAGVIQESNIDITGKVIQQSLTLLTEDQRGVLSVANFGNIFFGESRVINALLVNAGPYPLSFNAKYDDEDENTVLGAQKNADDQAESDDPTTFYMRSLTVSPLDGVVRPFSQVPITITFTPILMPPKKGFNRNHLKEYGEAKLISRTMKVECLDNMETYPLTLQGLASLPTVNISPTTLRFGECPVHDRRDIMLTLQNRTQLSTTFEFPFIANFKFKPNDGNILRGETVSVVASFLPSQLGNFKQNIDVKIAGSLKTIQLKAYAETAAIGRKPALVGGINLIPNDFETDYKFVNPEEEAAGRTQKRKEEEQKQLEIQATLYSLVTQKGKGVVTLRQNIEMNENALEASLLPPPIINASQERDELYNTDGLDQGKSKFGAAPIIDYAVLERQEAHQAHLQHNRKYNTFLQQAHATREVTKLAKTKQMTLARGAVDFSNPFGVNMGIERGLDEPKLKLPVASEPLWMADSGKGMGGAKLSTDENRLIQKKFNSVPATQAEQRDCTSEIPNELLKQIQPSHKLIDFGRVCVGSISAKSFAVYNGLKRSIIVKVEDLDVEVQQSKALCQVIPETSVAGFDIYFSSRQLGKVKKSFTWKINDLHAFKVHYLAEVVPIELTMNKTEITMEFPQDSLKPTLSTDIVLSNPGNSQAEFLWGNAGGFTVDPEKGAIPPNKSALVSITWNPHVGKRTEEELGLHITGGIDQTLRVKGILKETVAEFGDKRLMLGVMAVGTEREIITTVNNTGDNPLVFFINPIDDSLGVKIEPTEAFILPQESCELKITITPKITRSYDNTSITARVRGGKNITLRLSGSSIVPSLDMKEQTFIFGDVTVGSSSRTNMTLMNKSPIPATILLDLSNYLDFVPRLLHPLEEVDLATKEFGAVIASNADTTSGTNSSPSASVSGKSKGNQEPPVISGSTGMTGQEDETGNQLILMNNISLSGALLNNSNSNGSSSPRNGGGSVDSSLTNAADRRKAKRDGKQGRKTLENIWKIIIQPSATLQMELIFRPTLAKKYTFKLPMNTLGIKEDKTFIRDVQANSIASVLSISKFVIDFGDRVVSRDPLARVTYYLETVITNQSSVGQSFVINEGAEMCTLYEDEADTHSLSSNTAANSGASSMSNKPQIYFVSPLKADLAPGASVNLRVTYQPQQHANYHKKLGIHLKPPGALATYTPPAEERPYLNLLCVGSGVYPRLTFSSPTLTLPTVPLGYYSRACFTIFNNGYSALEVKHRVSPTVSVPLEISFPDGNKLGIMEEKIRVVVSAKSDQPVSWAGKIEFYDMDGERFFIQINGCSDNCLLTNYSFVRDYSEDFGFIGLDEQPVQFLPQQQIAELRQQETKRKEELRKQRSLERQRMVEGKNNPTGAGAVANGSKSIASEGSGAISKATNPSMKSKKSIKEKNPATMQDENAPRYPDGIDWEKSLQRVKDSNGRPATHSRYVKSAVPASVEAVFLLKWLNKNVCRKPFDSDRFPHCIVDNSGDLIVDCIEQMSGKKLTNLKPDNRGGMGAKSTNNNNNNDNGSTGTEVVKRASEKSKKIASVDRLVYKYQQIINFLITNGALLSHVNPIYLLNKEDHLLMQEYEMMRDKNIHVTPALLAGRRGEWESQWLEKCEFSWLEVLYQAVKVFILSRLSYKEYIKLPGVVLSNRPELMGGGASTVVGGASSMLASVRGGGNDEKNKTGNAKGKKGEKNQPQVPKDLQPSNVFNHSEAILLAWASYHIEHAENLRDAGASADAPQDFTKFLSFNKRVVDLDQSFKDFIPFCQLIHSHVTDITVKEEPLHGYTTVDRERIDDSFMFFSSALNEYHLQLDGISQEDILCSTRNIMLMLLHLYLLLPHLVPKTKIEFVGLLGVPISKKIELKNSAKRPLKYHAVLKGSHDFSIDTHEIIVPAESAADFLATLNAKFIKAVNAKLYFWNVRDNGLAHGATLCFELMSCMNGMKPNDVISRNKLSLFDLETFAINVYNPFQREGNFHVKMSVKYCQKSIEYFTRMTPGEYTRSGKSKKRDHDVFTEIPLTKPLEDEYDMNNNSNTNTNTNNDDWEIDNMFRQPFWCHEETFTIGRTNKTFHLYMLPFVMGKYTCQLTFSDRDLGEFSYEIHAEVGLPKAADRLEMAVLQDSTVTLALNLSAKNPVFEKAFVQITDMRIKNANKKIKARSIFQNLLCSNVSNEETGQANFTIDFTAPFFQFKKHVEVVSDYLKWGSSAKGTNPNPNMKLKKLPKYTLEHFEIPHESSTTKPDLLNKSLIQFTPSQAGVYKTTAVVYSNDNDHHDIRCVDILITAKVPDLNMQIEFFGPARKLIQQTIPITNDSEKDWTLFVNLTGKNFTVPKSVFVPANNRAELEVSYFAVAASEEEGKLQLKNPENNDIFEYTLLGKSEDPFAEDNLVFRCIARKKTNFTIDLPSITSILHRQGTRMFEVETDLPYVSFNNKAEFKADGSQFTFMVASPMGGLFSGQILFRDPDTDAIVWYTVTVEVAGPAEEKSIEVEATVRKAVGIEITLDNPTEEVLNFYVSWQGEGLLGDSHFELPPKSQLAADGNGGMYQLIFSPLKAGTFVGRISFRNDIVGEVWYRLQLKALPAPATPLGVIESMLGHTASIFAPIENPLSENVTFSVEVKDCEHFSVQPGKIHLGPFMQSQFEVTFRPSSLTETVSTQIKLLSRKLGEIVYDVSGLGLLPGVMPAMTIEGPLNEIVSQSIIFRNPFPHPLPLEIFLTADTSNGIEDSQAFSLLLRKTNEIVLGPKTPLHIPIGFAPARLDLFTATLQVRVASAVAGPHNLLWCYPIRGIAQAGPTVKLPILRVPSKTTFMKEQLIYLTGLEKVYSTKMSLQDFTIDMKIPEDAKKLVMRAFRVQPLSLVVVDNHPQAELALNCRLLFEPLRIFATTVELSIIARDKGVWKASISLEASDPEPDDVIKMNAKVGAVDQVRFSLNNRFLGHSAFQAYFTSNSSPHFTVSPMNGVLPPYGTDGTTFTITFAPKEYGMIESATLNIMTEDAQWSYAIKGTFPESAVNHQAIRSKIDNKR